MAVDLRPVQRIMLVDDHAIVRLGMRQLIAAEPDMAVCCEAATADEALTLARTDHPDLAIVDLSLEKTHGLELLRQLHQAVPSLRVLVLSMHDESIFAERAIRAGARGYIMKKRAITGLIDAIRQVLDGHIYASDAVLRSMRDDSGSKLPLSTDPLGTLTDRELQVFEMIGQGRSTARIAQDLGLSVKTIETYRSNIKQKMHLKDATDLLRVAVSRTLRP